MNKASAAASPTPKAAAKDDSGKSAPGRDPGFGFISLEQLLKNNESLKAAQTKLEEEKTATQKEYQSRIADYQKLDAELAPLNQRIAGMKDGDPAKADAVRERDEKTNVLKTREGEINQYRQQKEAEVQQKTAAMREPMIADIRGAVGRLGNSVNVLFDVSANTMSGVPFVMRFPGGADLTSRIASALDGKDSGSVNSARGVKVALVDMNKVFTQLQRTKDAEEKLNAARTAARTENDQRSAALKEEQSKLDSLSGAEKDRQTAKVKIMEGELNEFRSKKAAEVQQHIVRMGQPILADMASTLTKLDNEKVGLVLDSTGTGIAGVRVLVWSKDIPDLSADLTTVMNGNAKAAENMSGVSSAGLRFGVIDIERAYRSVPDGQKAETEIQEAVKRAETETGAGTPEGRMLKQQELGKLIEGKRREVLNRITSALSDIATAGNFNAVLDTSGKTLAQVPAVVASRDVPDLTSDVVAKASATAP
ncbi:MAG: OmpH family outer membrane protein [Verrucomicrobiota bacterium]|nr:OmpH family outer membrane protein [Verrucomicrobiota bacterium]